MVAYIRAIRSGVYIFLFVCLFCFLGPHPWHMEVPRLRVKLELQLPAYATATATSDTSRVFNLYHSSWQCRILNPLNEARDQTHILMDPRQVHQPLSHKGNSLTFFFTPPYPGVIPTCVSQAGISFQKFIYLCRYVCICLYWSF